MKIKRWTWNQAKNAAAALLAEGALTIKEIAREVDASERAINLWRLEPHFAARLAEHSARYRDRFLGEGLARKEARLAELTQQFVALKRVVVARAADKKLRKAPGGDTGYVVMRQRMVGEKEVTEYEVDTPTAREMRGTLQQIAEELGQYEKAPPQVQVNVAVENRIDVSKLTDDELRSLEAVASRIIAPSPGRPGPPQLP